MNANELANLLHLICLYLLPTCFILIMLCLVQLVVFIEFFLVKIKFITKESSTKLYKDYPYLIAICLYILFVLLTYNVLCYTYDMIVLYITNAKK